MACIKSSKSTVFSPVLWERLPMAYVPLLLGFHATATAILDLLSGTSHFRLDLLVLLPLVIKHLGGHNIKHLSSVAIEHHCSQSHYVVGYCVTACSAVGARCVCHRIMFTENILQL
jgi:hypothetical protein